MADFQEIGRTPFGQWSLTEIRAFAQALSGPGVAADGAAITAAAVSQMESIAELERDIATQTTKWTGDPAPRTFAVIDSYAVRSYESCRSTGRLVSNVSNLSTTATTTNARFQDIRREEASGGTAGAEIEAQLHSTYSTPVQNDAGVLPLGDEVKKVTFVPPVGKYENMHSEPGGPGGTEPPSIGGGGATITDGSAGDGGAGTTPTNSTVPGADAETTDSTASKVGQEEAPSNAASTPSTIGQQTPTGGGTGTGDSGGDSGAGTDGLGDAARDSTDPTSRFDTTDDAIAPVGSVLSPAIGTGSGARGGGTSVRGVGGGSVASPLGLRSESALGRAAAATTAVTPSSGARATSMPMGGAPGGAGQRGKDGRHRVPAYLIDRANGDEIVGERPLVAPPVIGQAPAGAVAAPSAPQRPGPPRGPGRDGPRRT